MNLEQLRKQAKELIKAARNGDAEALARLGDLPVRLASAQLVLAREQGFASWPALVHELAEQPFRTDLEYYEGRAEGIATVHDVPLAGARRDLAQRHGYPSWATLTRHVAALADGDEPPTPFMLAYRAVEDRDRNRLAELLDQHPELVRTRGTNGNDLLGMAGDLWRASGCCSNGGRTSTAATTTAGRSSTGRATRTTGRSRRSCSKPGRVPISRPAATAARR
jgi:hypothetical protein